MHCSAHGRPARVVVGAPYRLRVRAPGKRLAAPYLAGDAICGLDSTGAFPVVEFADEHFRDAMTALAKAGRPFSSRFPVVLELAALLAPATTTIDVSVEADDAAVAASATIAVRREGLPDLTIPRGASIVDGLPKTAVSAQIRATLPGHCQLWPRGAQTLAAGGYASLELRLRPASVIVRCVDARRRR